MDIFDVILSTEVLAGIVIAAALGLIVRCVLSFTSEAASMTPKLTKIESDLTRLREGMGDKKKLVEDLTAIVDPLKDREYKLRAYFDGLRNMELEHERDAVQSVEEEEAEKQKRMQRKRMGMD